MAENRCDAIDCDIHFVQTVAKRFSKRVSTDLADLFSDLGTLGSFV